ncbi:MAG: hypothetical protein EXR86_12465 [Gammaproteobacteria bacterium]|nr:hypothetical protein [Gammaproteobacteria bacterium]
MVFKFPDSSKKGKLLPFVFSSTQSYIHVHIAGAMNVVKDGGLVLESNKAITATTNASPVVVTSAAHGYSNGDRVFITGTGIGALDGRFWTVANIAANTFELSGSVAPGSTSATGTVARVFKLTTTYTEAQLLDAPRLKYTQLNDVMTLASQGVTLKNLSRTAHDAWTLADTAYEKGPFKPINVDNRKGVATTGVIGTITVQSTHAMFAAGNVGQLIYIEQKDYGVPWEVGKAVALTDRRRADGKYYEAQNAATTGTLRPTHSSDIASDGAVNWLYLHDGWGCGLITAFVDSNTVTVEVKSRFPDEVVKADKAITGAANNGAGLVRITSVVHGYADLNYVLVYDVGGTTEANGLWRISGVTANTFDLEGSVFANAYTAGGKASNQGGTYKWAFGAWGGIEGFPAVVSYFQQRRVAANTPGEPLESWYSGTNSFANFGKSSPIIDNDSFNMTLAASRSDPIIHLVDIGKLIAFTSASTSDVRPVTVGGGKWVIPNSDNDPTLTPTKRSARPQTSDYILYVEAKGQTIQDMAYKYESNSYSGVDLSVLSKHLLEGHTIVASAYQHVPFQIFWLVRDDGVLIGMTYLREQQIWGWHRHDTVNGFFEDVECISEGGEDAVYFIVRRTINGQTERVVERLASRLYSDIKDAQFVDCAVKYDGRNAGATTMTLSGGTTWDFGETFTLTATTAKFAATDVTLGNAVHFTANDGRIIRCLITVYTSPTVVSVTANRNVPLELRNVARTDWGFAKKYLDHLDYLEGETVSILADAHVHPQLAVLNGAITLQNAAVVVRAGLPITACLETLRLNVAPGGNLLENQKLAVAARILVEESRGIFAGSRLDDLYEFAQRSDENYDDPVTPLTGIAAIRVASSWEDSGRIFIKQTDPLPLSVLAIIPEFEVGGKV